jgi:TPR repeat protein
MGMIKMDKVLGQSFWVGILMLFMFSPSVFADAVADMALGDKAMESEDIPQAEKYYRLAAEQNYAPAQVAMGELMHSTLENDQAVGWFLMAAYQGDAAGAYDLGQMYVVGEGVEQNSAKALYWIKHSAEKNYLPAVEVIARAYRMGDLGLDIDLDQAKIWDAKLPALRAAANKLIKEKLNALAASQKAAREEAVKKATEKKTMEKKTNDEAAAKKVDAEDEATAKKASEKSEPVKK